MFAEIDTKLEFYERLLEEHLWLSVFPFNALADGLVLWVALRVRFQIRVWNMMKVSITEKRQQK